MTKNEVHQMVAMLQPVLKLPAAGEFHRELQPIKIGGYICLVCKN